MTWKLLYTSLRNARWSICGNYKPDNCFSVLRSVVEELLLEAICSHVMDMKMIQNSQHEFTNGKSSALLYDKIVGSVGKRRAADIWKAFSNPLIVSYNILFIKLVRYELEKWMMKCVENLSGPVLSKACGQQYKVQLVASS